MKKVVRLTESDLHRIVKNSVKRIIKENYEEEGFVDRVKGAWQGAKQGANTLNTNAQNSTEYTNLTQGAGRPQDEFRLSRFDNRQNYELGSQNFAYAYRNIGNAINCLKQVHQDGVQEVIQTLMRIESQLMQLSYPPAHRPGYQ